MSVLTTLNHDRGNAGMTYVYPVVSRRAGGVSVGVNLNPNNACNWRCIYCQVPGLVRGGPPVIDLVRLESELRQMLTRIVQGDFLRTQVPEEMSRLTDVALSGNGEPTSAPEFPVVIELIRRVLLDFELLGRIKLILITNGSLASRPRVQSGLRAMSTMGGEVWFKFDRATRSGFHQVNDTACDPERHYQRLKKVASLCPTWVQTCLFALDGQAPAGDEMNAWLALLERSISEQVPLRGVLLYGLARPSMQAEGPRLSALPAEWMQALADRVRALGLEVRLSL